MTRKYASGIFIQVARSLYLNVQSSQLSLDLITWHKSQQTQRTSQKCQHLHLPFLVFLQSLFGKYSTTYLLSKILCAWGSPANGCGSSTVTSTVWLLILSRAYHLTCELITGRESRLFRAKMCSTCLCSRNLTRERIHLKRAPSHKFCKVDTLERLTRPLYPNWSWINVFKMII